MLIIITLKILFLITLITIGIFARRYKLLSKAGEQDLSKLLVDLFWPAAIFASITGSLKQVDILDNAILPLLALVTAFTGLLIAYLFSKLLKLSHNHKKIYLYHGAINNFVFMVLPFATLFLAQRGEGLLFLHNLGFLLFLWSVGVALLQDKSSFKNIVIRLISPGLIATIGGITVVMLNLQNEIPLFLQEIIATAGKPTVIIAMLIAGSQIYDLGTKALKFNRWNISLGLIRLVIVPGILFIIALLLRPYVSQDVLLIFMLVNVMPVSVNSISIARRFGSSPELAAESVVFTHLFGIATMLGFIYMIQLVFVS